MQFPELILFIYEAIPRAIGLYYEKAFKQLGYQILTCDISSTIRKPDLLCKPDQDLQELLQELPTQPDLIIYFESRSFFPRGWEKISQPKIWYSTEGDVHLKDHEAIIDFFDMIFSSNYYVAQYFQNQHPQSFWLPLAVDPETHYPINQSLTYDIAFVGTLNMVQYRQRARLLKQLQEHFKVNIVTQATPRECAEIYAQAHLVFDKSLGYGINTRPFEALACKKVLFTEENPLSGIELLFNNHRELVYYNETNLISLIEEYLTNKEKRELVANQGYQEAIKYHTYQHRVQTLLGLINQITGCGLKLQAPPHYSREELPLKYAQVYTHNYMFDAAKDILQSIHYLPRVQVTLAINSFLQQDPQQALKHIQTALKDSPNSLEWLYYAAAFAFALTDYSSALDYLEQIKKLHSSSIIHVIPSHLTSHLGSAGMEGAIHFYQQSFKQAIFHLEKTLQEKSYHEDACWYIYHLLSQSYQSEGNLSQAEHFAKIALKENAYYEDNYLVLATIYQMKQQEKLAIQCLQQGIQLLESHETLQSYLNNFNQSEL